MATILVVDDDPSVGEVINAFFSKLKGYTVYTTQDPEEVVDLVQKHDPQVVLLDIMMPGVHGVEVLRRIKQVSPDVKVIMITAMDDEAIAREAIEAGAVDYVTKPLDLDYLDTAVTFQLLD